MIYPELTARLGNQMFQVAVAISLADRLGTKAVLPDWKYARIFGSKFNFESTDNPGNKTLYSEPCFNYKEIPEHEGDLLLRGYFQSEKYFNEEIVRAAFRPNQEIRSYIQNKWGNILKTGTASLHVRRGDYLNLKEYHPELSVEDYYYKAISSLCDWHGNPPQQVLVFSDDIPWCKKTFEEDYFIFSDEMDVIDLFLMSMCKDHIIANSSFSWWGAWLNPDKDKRVVAPDPWFGPGYAHYDTSDLLPESWEVVKWRE